MSSIAVRLYGLAALLVMLQALTACGLVEGMLTYLEERDASGNYHKVCVSVEGESTADTEARCQDGDPPINHGDIPDEREIKSVQNHEQTAL